MSTRPLFLLAALALSAGAQANAPGVAGSPVPPVVVAPSPMVAEIKQSLQAMELRFARLEAQLQNQGLLNLLNQVEALKAEIARLRGTQEEQAQQLVVTEKRTKDLYADLDGRVKELADRPVPPPADAIRLQPAQSISPATSPPVAQDAEGETKSYEAAYNLVKSGRYKEAIATFETFLQQFPSGNLAANAWYWLGFSHIATSDFKGGTAIFQRMIKDYPGNPKAPDAMLSLARAHVQLNEADRARAVLDQLVAKHPASRAAENGKRLLSTLK